MEVGFQTEIKRELNQTRLIIRLDGLYTEDYQVRMLRENAVKGLLSANAHGEGEGTVYEYDITGLTSLRQYYKQRKITWDEMNAFLKQVQEAMEEVEEYLLNPNRLLMDPAYIFFDDGTYWFCYFPQGEEDIRLSFHRLMDEFVQWTDYQDIPGVKAAFFLHKETMKENYSLKKVVQGLAKLREEEAVEPGDALKREQPEEEGIRRQGALEYDSEEHDWITRQEMGSEILKETDNLWSPVKRLLHRHKRPKWGDWDGIYIDEEEF